MLCGKKWGGFGRRSLATSFHCITLTRQYKHKHTWKIVVGMLKQTQFNQIALMLWMRHSLQGLPCTATQVGRQTAHNTSSSDLKMKQEAEEKEKEITTYPILHVPLGGKIVKILHGTFSWSAKQSHHVPDVWKKATQLALAPTNVQTMNRQQGLLPGYS